MAPFNYAKTKIQLKLAIQRTRTMAAKQEAMAKKSRRDIASLIEKGKLETARVKVETIINSDIHIELLELLELYCELLLARFGMIEASSEVDPGISEAVSGIIYAAPRTEIRELHVLRELLMSRYGRDYSLRVLSTPPAGSAEPTEDPPLVSARVLSKLPSAAAPDTVLIDGYTREICLAYGVPLPPGLEGPEDKAAAELAQGVPEPTRLEGSGATSAPAMQGTPAHPSAAPRPDPGFSGTSTASYATAPGVGASAPASPTLGKAKSTGLPAAPSAAPGDSAPARKADVPPPSAHGDVAFDALAARFAALKKR